MIIAVDPAVEMVFYPKDQMELPEPKRTGFKHRVMTRREASKMQDNLATIIGKVGAEVGDSQEMRIKSGSHAYMAIKNCLTGFVNFKDKDGNDVKFEINKDKEPLDKIIDLIPGKYFTEIANAFTEGHDLSEDAKKK